MHDSYTSGNFASLHRYVSHLKTESITPYELPSYAQGEYLARLITIFPSDMKWKQLAKKFPTKTN